MILALLLAFLPSVHPFDSGVVNGSAYEYAGADHFNPAPFTGLDVGPMPAGTAEVEVNVQYDTEITYFFANPWPLPIDSINFSRDLQQWFTNPSGETYPYLGGLGTGSFLQLTNMPVNSSWQSSLMLDSQQQTFRFGLTPGCTPQVPLGQFDLDPTLYYASTYTFVPTSAVVGGRYVQFDYSNNESHYKRAVLTTRAHGFVIYRDINGVEL